MITKIFSKKSHSATVCRIFWNRNTKMNLAVIIDCQIGNGDITDAMTSINKSPVLLNNQCF